MISFYYAYTIRPSNISSNDSRTHIDLRSKFQTNIAIPRLEKYHYDRVCCVVNAFSLAL